MNQRHKTTLTRRNFEMPRLCCVCGTPVDSVIQYEQEDIPIPGPGLIPFRIRVYVQSRKMQMPYCPDHARRFQMRLRWYHILQAAFFISGMLLLMGQAGSDRRVFGGLSFVVLAIGMLLFKASILYDARIHSSKDGLVLEAPSMEFIAAVNAALLEASELSKAEGRKPVDEKTRDANRKTNLRRARERLRRSE